jgi:NADH-quinone oxidoreductase subunit F
LEEIRAVKSAIAEADRAGLLGDMRIIVHAGAGAYICGVWLVSLDRGDQGGSNDGNLVTQPLPLAELWLFLCEKKNWEIEK